MKLYDVIRKEQLAERSSKSTTEVAEVVVDESTHPTYHQNTTISWRKIAVIAVALGIVCGLYIVGMALVHAKVVITERRIPFSLTDATLELTHEKDASEGALSFQAMVITTEVTREIFGSQVTPSITKASGTIVIFNEYSKTKQTIKSGTMVTAANGKRYITQVVATIPGYTMNGKLKVPGTSPAIRVVATDTGPSYNSDGTTFTIAGWTGTRAKQLYARSAGPITGGEEGAAHTVAPADRDRVIATLQAQLTERLKRETRAQIPDDLVTFPDLQFISIDSDSLKLQSQSIKIEATLKGTMVSYLIPRALLEKAIAHKALSEQQYDEVSIPALTDLTVTPVSSIPSGSTTVPIVLTIRITGQGIIIAKVPIASIRQTLVGKRRRDFAQLLNGIPEIDKARYTLTPFWAPFFPRSESDIAVSVE